MGNPFLYPVSNGHMRSVTRLGAVGVYFLCSIKALACFCFSTPMCSTVGTMSGSQAVFVGRVVEVWPSKAVIVSGHTNFSLAALRSLLLQRWKGSLSREEEG